MGNKALESGLKKIKKLQNRSKVFATKEFDALEVTELKKAGFLREIINGWVYLSSPIEEKSETTSWFMNYWEFVRKYLKHRFKNEYCLNPEASLMLHSKERYIPKQIVIITKNGAVSNIKLPFGVSLLTYPDTLNFPKKEYIVKVKDINAMCIEYALCKVSPTYWRSKQREIEILISSKWDLQKVVEILTTSKTTLRSSANRIYSALIFLKKDEEAKLLKSLYDFAFGGSLSFKNPFSKNAMRFLFSDKPKSIISLKLEAMWHSYKHIVQDMGREIKRVHFLPNQIDTMLEAVKEEDMYHSLSIEGYKITNELIQKVINGNWNPQFNDEDKKTKDALSAKGYADAFEEIKKDLEKEAIEQNYPNNFVEKLHQKWYAKLFNPCVKSGILSLSDLAGYRRHQVFIRNSKHVPLEECELRDAMDTYFQLLANEKDTFVKAVLGHHLFGYIHPYMDGNGRMARFIMNALFVQGGITWTIIKVDKRDEYMKALEEASVNENITPFATFVLEAVKKQSLYNG